MNVRPPRTLPRTLPHHGYRTALVFAALMAGLTGLVWGASSEALQAASSSLDWLVGHDTARGRMLASVFCATAGALALIAAWGRETAERRPVRLAGGRARMAVEEVATTLRDALLDDATLADAAVRVQNLHWRGLRVTVRADLRPQARVDDTVEAVDRVVVEIVQGELGARLAARPAVDVRYQELDLRLGRAHDGRDGA
ncbi:MAG: hypothetical protein DWI58_19875 [Chloroflexi bacterium]|nr:MAG: hypothetical protein DWI58_19875 [Chloroflexota bacterium]